MTLEPIAIVEPPSASLPVSDASGEAGFEVGAGGKADTGFLQE